MATQIKFGTSGWRAVVAEEFTFENVRRAVHGIARYVASQKARSPKVIVGRDPRFLGETFCSMAAEILSSYQITPLVIAEAEDLIRIAAERKAVLQVGHIERFNPAVDVLKATVSRPRFIEVHRLGSFSPRSLDIDVVLDLMIHDLDIVLTLDGSEAVQIDAVGVPVLTNRVDIANVRLRFASGLIANLTASRVSAEKVRKFRVFSPRTYISVDFARREAQVYRLTDGIAGPEIKVEQTAAPDEEPLRRQLAAFVECASSRRPPVVSGADGLRALRLAHVILARIAEQP